MARIAELSGSPHRRSTVTELYWEKIDEKGMSLDVDGRRGETGMTGCQMAMSFRGEMQRLEMCVDLLLVPRSSCGKGDTVGTSSYM